MGDRFPEAIVRAPRALPIDLALARRQHAAYVQALRSLGVEVTELPPLDEHPDACFVEDCAVVACGVALIARLGAPTRRGEAASVQEALGGRLETAPMEAPATLDGGDCLRLGDTLYVGRSERTNAQGVARVRDVLEPRGLRVVEIEGIEALHLKCVCSPLDEGRVLVARGAFSRSPFVGVRVVEIPAAEAYAANVVSVNGTVLVAAGFPETARALADEGFRTEALDISEVRKADGSLTCLSILF